MLPRDTVFSQLTPAPPPPMASTTNQFTRFWRSQNSVRRITICIGLFIIISMAITSSASTKIHVSQVPTSLWQQSFLAPAPRTFRTIKSNYAFATFLAETANEATEAEEDDKYLICTRMLAYQLLHDPETRTNNSIPFIVLVSPGVSQWKRHRLQSEGATVVEASAVNVSWIKPGRDRWAHVMDKLNVFRLVQFEKILLLDSDIVIFKRLDPVFESPETDIMTNLGVSSKMKNDEGTQPQRYLMAGDSSPARKKEDKYIWPAKRHPTGPCNAGFVVLHPSEEMYQHQLKIISIEGRFSGTAPEQNLWNYIHRPDGNMPWSRLNHTWIMNTPVYDDYKMGVAAVHEKWFRGYADSDLKEMLLRSRYRMEGFWSGGQQPVKASNVD